MTSFSLRPESYEEGTSREWLLANGLGGYASSTISGGNTRSYHGLLVASLSPPVDRWLLLSSLDEEIDGHALANHQYPKTIYPRGFRYLKEFFLDPFPRFCYQVADCRIEKTVFMIHGENTTIISYKIKNGQGHLRIVPLVHSRGFHAASPLPGMSQEPLPGGVVIRSASRPDLSLSLLSDGPAYQSCQDVYYSFEYEEERRRGLSWSEDLYSPGSFEMELSGDAAFAIAASTWRSSMPDWRAELRRERSRLSGLKAPFAALAMASDSFLAKRGNSLSIIAGYHWFDDWGRDAMIALPGLLLTTGRKDEAAMVLRFFASAMKNGVLPNDLGARSYNTVDASLWFVRAVSSYFEYSRDRRFLKEIWPGVVDVFRRYSQPGDDFGAAEDGLIISGPALTWMDARLEGRPVTPRAGKCCEINALWYSALMDMNRLYLELGKRTRNPHPELSSFAERVKDSYQRFWNSETGCLYDVIDPEDASIRPNQIIAAGIDGLLPEIKRVAVFEVVTRDLLTPFGLRTLTPRDPRYEGRYEGDPRRRDGSYHQGTVWPWLIGPYIDALLAIKGRKRKVLTQAREILQPLMTLQSGGIETIPEVFDGDSPQRPGGCISQAWSVAEVLRAWQAIQ